MEIKTFNEKRDFEYICSTFEDLYFYNLNEKIPQKRYDEMKNDFLDVKSKKSKKVFIGFKNNSPVGYIYFFIKTDKYTNSKSLIISSLYINENERKKGYAKLLFKKAKEFAEKRGCIKIGLNTFEINYEVYKKLGFDVKSYWMEMKI